MVFGSLKQGIEAIMHPGSGTKPRMNVSEALVFYYKFSLVPLILLIVMFFAIVALFSSSVPQLSTLGSYSKGFVAVILVFYLWLAVPLGMLIESAVYHVIGKVLRFFKGGYENTFTAVMFSSLPVIAVLWLALLPVVGGIVILIATVWAVYMVSVALSNQHGTTVLNGFLVWLVLFIIAIAVLGLFAGAALSTLAANPAS